MHPILFRIPVINLPLHTYGVMIVIGFLTALYCAHREALRQGKYADEILDFAFFALLGGMIGARVIFIAVNWHEYFVEHFWEVVTLPGGSKISIPSILVVWKGGLVFYGAALGGFAAYLWYTKKHKIRGADRLMFIDFLIVGLPLAAAFGRLGCVAAGCCWGESAYHIDDAGKVISDIPLAAYFPEKSLAYTSLIGSVSSDIAGHMRAMKTTMPLVPVQLMDSFLLACMFLVLLVVRSRKRYHGQVLLVFGILYPIQRSFLETFRGDEERGHAGILSTSQLISLFVVIASVIAMVILRKRGSAATTTPGTPA